MKVVTGAQMRALDQAAIHQLGIPGIALMENAGLRVVETIADYFDNRLTGKRVTIIAGKGNNGGDGLVVARHLYNKQARVKIFLTAGPGELSGDAAVNMGIIEKLDIPVYQLQEEDDLTRLNVSLLYTDMVVDAMFGTGFHGPPRGRAGQIIQTVNDSRVPVLAVDIPSGLEADTGKIKGPCIRADITVTFALPKLGLLVEPGAGVTGKLVIGDISIPRSLVDSAGLKMETADLDWCAQQVPRRQATGHKGTYGHVLVIGGSSGMVGAPVMAAKAALKTGAGLVTVAVPKSLQALVASQVSETLTAGLPETGAGTFSAEAAEQLMPLVAGASAVVIGPGMSRHDEVEVLLKAVLPKLHKPTVVDADALNIIARVEQAELQLPGSAVLTPHPGEMARLLGCSTGQVQSDRLAAVTAAAKKYRATVLLKGARSLVATPDEYLYVNTTGNPGMATGGSGDVLAGMLGALLAQGLMTGKAGAVAAFLHGLAGDEAAAVKGQMGLVAGDLIEQIPHVLHTLGR